MCTLASSGVCSVAEDSGLEVTGLIAAASKKNDDAVGPSGAARTTRYTYSLKSALALDDNKALAVAMAATCLAQGSSTKATVSDLSRSDGWLNVALIFAWQAIGVALMEITRIITDRIVVSNINLPNEVVQKRNLAAGIVEACAHIGSGQVISASLSGPANSWAVDILSMLMWFVIGQTSFIIFAAVMRCKNNWNFSDEIKNGNHAAALVFGINKITIGIFSQTPFLNQMPSSLMLSGSPSEHLFLCL